MTEKTTNRDPSLELLHRENIVFRSYGHWLHPLFDLEDFLGTETYPLDEVLLRDKIIGKAAALLIVRLGIRRVEAGILSLPGESTLKANGVQYTFRRSVDRISCQTEELLKDESDPEEAHRILAKRAGRGGKIEIQRMKFEIEMNEPAIVLDNVSVELGQHRILNNLSATINRGERLLITGENGAGKTTLLKTVLGLVTPMGGTVHVLGSAVGSKEWLSQRRRVGYLNQEFAATDFSITAYEVAEIGASEVPVSRKRRREIVLDAMHTTGCLDLKSRPYAVLSGGEKRKVALARCLSQRAEVLLLDEPTSFLHPDSKAEILSILEKLSHSNGITLLMVSHDSVGKGLYDWSRGELLGGQLWCAEALGEKQSS